MFKLNSVGRKLYFSVLAVFLVFAVSFIVFQQAREKQYKDRYAYYQAGKL